jgi:uncharacterized protein
MNKPFIIDSHTHISATSAFLAHYHSVDDFIMLMDKINIELSLFVCMPMLERQFDMGYKEALEAMQKYPNRLAAYTSYDPNWPDISMELIEKYQFLPGFVGIKIHPSIHAVAPEDSKYLPLWAFANKHKIVVLSHTWSPDAAKPTQNLATPNHFESVLAQYKDMRLVLGHCGGRESGMLQAIDLLKRYTNCYADISGDRYIHGQLEELIKQVGIEKILFGSDSNWIEPRYVLGHVLKSRLSVDDRYKILRTNAIDLFGDLLPLN